MKNEILCGCVIFPQLKEYFNFFFESIKLQTCQNFTLLIIEDGLSCTEYLRGLKFKCVCIPVINSTVISNRELILEYAIKNNYEKIIFFDGDDVYSEKRVEMLSEYLNKYDLVVHDMDIIDENNKCLEHSFINNNVKEGTFGFEDLLNRNFSGLGNSGYRVEILKEYKSVRNDIIAFDWWIALNSLLNGNGVGFYIPNVLSHYRRYDENTTSIRNHSKESITTEYKVKILLYTELLLKMNVNKKQANLIQKSIGNVIDKYYSYEETSQTSYVSNGLWWDILE